MELHQAIGICRTCSEVIGSKRRRPLMESKNEKKLNEMEIKENAESEGKKKEVKK